MGIAEHVLTNLNTSETDMPRTCAICTGGNNVCRHVSDREVNYGHMPNIYSPT